MSEDELRDQLQGSDAFRGLMEALGKIADVARDGIEIFCDAIREEIVPLCRSVIDVFRELIGAVNRKESQTRRDAHVRHMLLQLLLDLLRHSRGSRAGDTYLGLRIPLLIEN